MTITRSERSTGDTLGFHVSGDVTKADYDVLTPAVAAAVDQHGSVNLMLDLTDFHWEKVSAWGADLRFGHEYHDKIDPPRHSSATASGRSTSPTSAHRSTPRTPGISRTRPPPGRGLDS